MVHSGTVLPPVDLQGAANYYFYIFTYAIENMTGDRVLYSPVDMLTMPLYQR